MTADPVAETTETEANEPDPNDIRDPRPVRRHVPIILATLLALAVELALAGLLWHGGLDIWRALAAHGAFVLLLAGATTVYWRRAGGALPAMVLLVLATFLLGPIGPIGSLFTLTFYLATERNAPQFSDWYESLFPDENETDSAPDAAQRAQWLDYLIGGGAAQRALELVEADPGPPDGPVFGSYLNALAALRMREPLAEGLNQRILVEDKVETLRHLGQLAGANLLTAQTLAAYEKLLVQRPDDREALREAGLAASAEGDYRTAARHIDRYLELGDGDAEMHFLYAEILGALGWTDMAAYHYRIAVEQVAALPAPAFASRMIEANALARLGETEKAEAAFGILRRERPGNAQLRADLASLLIDSRDYDGAERVLGQE